MNTPRDPSLYQINTRVWLTELSAPLGRPATLDDIPDAELDRLAAMGFDWIWLLSVWQTGLAGQEFRAAIPSGARNFEETLPDLRDEDIPGSGFAITGYTVHTDLGGDAALARLRERLRSGAAADARLRAQPHRAGSPLGREHPEYFVPGTELDLCPAPKNYTWVKRQTRGSAAGARPRSPTFPDGPTPCSSTTATRPRRRR